MDIRAYKTELRSKYMSIRKNMDITEKNNYDTKIFNRLISLEQYINAKQILVFVSKDIEVDTKRLIEYSFSIGKQVAVPKCLNNKGLMSFYYINSLSELSKDTFGVLEPDINKAIEVTDYTSSICILPGLAFDKTGYRLGFGKGFYDRFLQNYAEIKIGICYNECVTSKLPHGRFDKKADFIVTPKYTLTISS